MTYETWEAALADYAKANAAYDAATRATWPVLMAVKAANAPYAVWAELQGAIYAADAAARKAAKAAAANRGALAKLKADLAK